MKPVIIAGDSTLDLNEELMTRYGIHTVPLTVNLGGKLFLDGLEVTPDDIYRHYEEKGELPKTSAPNIADFEDFFKKWTDESYEVVFFTISAQMSATFNNARLAAEEIPGVYVVDTANLSTGGGLLAVAAGEMAKKGMGASQIAEECRRLVPCVDASFVVDNLEFLHKGGRCSAVAAFGANLLQLKPCITVKNGKMGVHKKYRGKFAKTLSEYVEERIGNAEHIRKERIFVTHAGCDPEIVQQCVEQVKAAADFDEVHITRAGCTISSHCGRNTLGVLFIRKDPIV